MGVFMKGTMALDGGVFADDWNMRRFLAARAARLHYLQHEQ
jgi:hypothetical protein